MIKLYVILYLASLLFIAGCDQHQPQAAERASKYLIYHYYTDSGHHDVFKTDEFTRYASGGVGFIENGKYVEVYGNIEILEQ